MKIALHACRHAEKTDQDIAAAHALCVSAAPSSRNRAHKLARMASSNNLMQIFTQQLIGTCADTASPGASHHPPAGCITHQQTTRMHNAAQLDSATQPISLLHSRTNATSASARMQRGLHDAAWREKWPWSHTDTALANCMITCFTYYEPACTQIQALQRIARQRATSARAQEQPQGWSWDVHQQALLLCQSAH